MLTSPVCWSQFLMPPAKTVLCFSLGKKYLGLVSIDILSQPEPSRNKLNHHKSSVFIPRMSALKQGSKSIFAGVHIYKKIRELLQNSASKGESTQQRKREGDRTTHSGLEPFSYYDFSMHNFLSSQNSWDSGEIWQDNPVVQLRFRFSPCERDQPPHLSCEIFSLHW